MEFSLVPNQSGNTKYNLVWINLTIFRRDSPVCVQREEGNAAGKLEEHFSGDAHTGNSMDNLVCKTKFLL